MEQVRPFWAAVEECLHVYHGVPREEAAALVKKEWQEHEERNEPYGDIVYHDEPFRVWEILNRHGW